VLIILNLIYAIINLFVSIDLDISFFDFMSDTQNSNNYGQPGGTNNSSGGGPGNEEQHIYRSESNTDQDNDNSSSSKRQTPRARLLEKPSDNVEINTVEDAINHIEKLKQREINLRHLIAKGQHEISRDIRLRDLDISFKKPLSNIAKYLDNCRKMEDPGRRLFHKSSPGNTPVNNILGFLRKKL
tara:strand:+ start:1332 stop:1886 length:555 start_codon:yes stop_codon:yes gene_type:complete